MSKRKRDEFTQPDNRTECVANDNVFDLPGKFRTLHVGVIKSNKNT